MASYLLVGIACIVLVVMLVLAYREAQNDGANNSTDNADSESTFFQKAKAGD